MIAFCLRTDCALIIFWISSSTLNELLSADISASSSISESSASISSRYSSVIGPSGDLTLFNRTLRLRFLKGDVNQESLSADFWIFSITSLARACTWNSCSISEAPFCSAATLASLPAPALSISSAKSRASLYIP